MARWCRPIPARRCFPAGRAWRRFKRERSPLCANTTGGWPWNLGGGNGSDDGDVLWLACTHGDVIKSLLADAFGMHLDSFQRINADPASVSVIRYTQLRPFVLHVNHTGGRLSAALRAAPPPQAEPEAEPRTNRMAPAV